MDEKFILTMIDKFNSAGIAKLKYSNGTARLVLRKESANPVCVREPEIKIVTESVPQEPAGAVEKIKSPIVATFYSAPGPDTPPYVQQGSKVKAGQTLCILEAMKIMNHLQAEFDCEIIGIHAYSGDIVEYDQAIFTVKRN